MLTLPVRVGRVRPVLWGSQGGRGTTQGEPLAWGLGPDSCPQPGHTLGLSSQPMLNPRT